MADRSCQLNFTLIITGLIRPYAAFFHSSRRKQNAALGALLMMTMVGGCGTQTTSNIERGDFTSPLSDELSLLQKVHVFATDDGDPGREALMQLESYPREDLIAALERLRQSRSEGLTPTYVAFLFCNLMRDYEANRSIITNEFRSSSHDRARLQTLLARLIRKGDKALLHELFAAAPAASGEFLRGLSETLVGEIVSSPEQFLSMLKAEPPALRRHVHALVHLTAEDREQVVRVLGSIPKKSPNYNAASEMLSAFSKLPQD